MKIFKWKFFTKKLRFCNQCKWCKDMLLQKRIAATYNRAGTGAGTFDLEPNHVCVAPTEMIMTATYFAPTLKSITNCEVKNKDNKCKQYSFGPRVS